MYIEVLKVHQVVIWSAQGRESFTAVCLSWPFHPAGPVYPFNWHYTPQSLKVSYTVVRVAWSESPDTAIKAFEGRVKCLTRMMMSDDCSTQAAVGMQTAIAMALKIYLGKWCGWKVAANSSMTRTSCIFFYCNVPREAPPVGQATPTATATGLSSWQSHGKQVMQPCFYKTSQSPHKIHCCCFWTCPSYSPFSFQHCSLCIFCSAPWKFCVVHRPHCCVGSSGHWFTQWSPDAPLLGQGSDLTKALAIITKGIINH